MAPVDVSGKGWKIRQGQAVWRPKSDAAEVAGDLFIANNPDGRSLVQFSKTPIPLIVAQTDTNYWEIKFVPRDKRYGGELPPPGRLIWPGLSACLDGSGVPAPWEFKREKDGRWVLENKNSGERIEGFVTPGLPDTLQIKPNESLQSLALRSGVTAQDLREANPQLEWTGDGHLKPGQTVRIPVPAHP